MADPAVCLQLMQLKVLLSRALYLWVKDPSMLRAVIVSQVLVVTVLGFSFWRPGFDKHSGETLANGIFITTATAFVVCTPFLACLGV